MDDIVNKQVECIPGKETGKKEKGNRSDDEPEQEEQDSRKKNRQGKRHGQALLVGRECMVDPVDPELPVFFLRIFYGMKNETMYEVFRKCK